MLENLKFNFYAAAIAASAGAATGSGYGALALFAVSLLRAAVGTARRSSWHKTGRAWAAGARATATRLIDASHFEERRHAYGRSNCG